MNGGKGNYGFFIILILIFGLVLYFIFSSPNIGFFFKNNSTSTVIVKTKSPVTGNVPNFGSGPASPYYLNNYGGQKNNNSQITAPGSTQNAATHITPPIGFTSDQLSPYYGKITISGISAPSSFNPFSRISLSANSAQPIDVTGWQIKGNHAQLPNIPQTIDDFSAIGSNIKTDIVLSQNSALNIYSNRSPLGQNIRLNKCTGYLDSAYNFQPALPKTCPSPVNGSTILLSSRCQTFIRSLSACRVPTANERNMFSAPDESVCRAQLDQINYGGCYQEHRADPDFFTREWRVWLGYDFYFDNQHDRLLLFDENNLLVDDYTY